MKFHKDILMIDPKNEIEKTCNFINEQTHTLRRKGAVIGLSGGIDSALCSELLVKALGKEKVFGLILPEKESNPISSRFALKQAKKIGIEVEAIDISPVLESFGTYSKRDEVIKEIFPEYEANSRIKLTLPSDLLAKDALNFYTLTMDNGGGKIKSERLKGAALRQIIAATDTKQRTRMMHLYYYAEKMNYFVCGTTNKTETVQGFFVKFGDGGVDIEPIGHLYKTQVYQLSRELGIIPEIINRTPSPDTFSFAVSDEEFYFRMPFDKLDMLLFAWENSTPLNEVCEIMSITEDQVKRAFRDFTSKFNATKHLRNLPPSIG